jgi:hypothetical protein
MLGSDAYAAYLAALLNGTAPRPSEGNGTRPPQPTPTAEATEEPLRESESAA